jgi:pimeloyl-ACP methyl ester carboxylesterase
MPDSATCAPAPERCFRPSDFAADLLAFMERKGIPRAHLVGHSMGSLVAQELALTHPNRVGRLVLIGSSATTAGHPVVMEFFLAGLIEGPWRDALVRQGRSFPGEAYRSLPTDADTAALSWMLANFVVEPLADSGLLALIAPETVRTPIGTWLGVARALSAYDNAERLASLEAPTLVLWGSQDNLFTEADQIRLREVLDRAVASCRMGYVWKQYGVKPLPESGQPTDDVSHNLQWAVPEAVAADLAAFLKENGMPTDDLPYGTGQGPAAVRNAPGKARVISRMPANCRADPGSNEAPRL